MTHSDATYWEHRVQETEIKLAFLDKELDEYKEAVQTLHSRLELLEKTVERLKSNAQGDGGAGSGSLG